MQELFFQTLFMSSHMTSKLIERVQDMGGLIQDIFNPDQQSLSLNMSKSRLFCLIFFSAAAAAAVVDTANRAL